jgi:hypothetical protein
VDHAARAEFLLERGILRIIDVLRFLFRIEVIEVAEEFVEAVRGRQELVTVAQVVLAELSRGVAERLQEVGDSWILRAQAHVGARQSDLG